MAFPMPVTAAQVGTYFVGQYYQMLQNQPDFVHQFYSDMSTMLRIDGNTRETATAMLQIHQLVTTLNYMGLEIKTAHSLESWNGGVLVIVSGSVCVKNFNGKKKFVETFFLAPQEKGYFILNDVFHYVEEEQIMQHPISTYLPPNNLDSSATAREQVNNFMLGPLGGDIKSREFIAPPPIVQENGNYDYPEERLEQVPVTEIIVDDNFSVHSNGSLQGTLNSNPNALSSSSIEEPVVETHKHTYASIVAKGKKIPAVPSQNSRKKSASIEDPHAHESRLSPNNPIESSQSENLEETFVVEDEVEVRSVYVRNVPTTMSASEIADEFKKFGKLRPDAVAIRTRKDIDICYAFVEFEDNVGVHNAIKASTVQIGAHQLYIEERRPNRHIPFRGGRARGGGRGRLSHHAEGSIGRFGNRGFGRGTHQDTFDRDYYYSRPRANGFYRQPPPRQRAYSANRQGSDE